MSLYTYTGPLTALTLPSGTELVLVNRAVVDIPPGPIFDDLNGLGRLAAFEPPTEPQPETEPKPAKPKKGGDA